jgi:hypothetical protein
MVVGPKGPTCSENLFLSFIYTASRPRVFTFFLLKKYRTQNLKAEKISKKSVFLRVSVFTIQGHTDLIYSCAKA